MAEQDIREDQMIMASSVDYLRGLKGKDSVLISPKNAAHQMKVAQELDLASETEIDTGMSNYGLYQLDNYSAGACAVFIVNFNSSMIVSSIGGTFGSVSGEGSLSLYKKGSNGNIFIRNNIGKTLKIGFKRI